MRRMSFFSIFGTVQFHQQKYAQLYKCAQLENTLKFYAVYSMLCARRISLLEQKQSYWLKSCR